MRDSGNEYRPPSRDYFVMLANTILILMTVVFLLTVFSMYRDRMQAISLNENRFLTTEWRLLQKLREQTDRILLEKEQEIAELNGRYLNLIRENATRQELRQIESRLQRAQDERVEILTRRTAAAAGTESDRSSWLKDLLPEKTPPLPDAAQSDPVEEVPAAPVKELLSREGQFTVSELLRSRLKELERELEESRLRIATLESGNSAVRTQPDGEILKSSNEAARDLVNLKRLEETIVRLTDAARTAAAELNDKSRDSSQRARPDVEDLAVRALIRAVVGSPEIRSEYPDLLPSFDRYLESFGLQERLKGRSEAYDEAARALGPLSGETVPGCAAKN